MEKESDFAVMQRDVEEIKVCQLKILKILQGDNGEGIVTKVALNRQSIKRAWYWIGGITVLIPLAGIFGWLIREVTTK